ncbi:hypothetical protein NDU88_000932 [Pleurodeles waltl]|uniref:Uncharacterized protein n=1 Tax=Pleurodeles waltl TaxID=8319 RepID=A0AAV7Q1P1_PLEWA|nr:hypothetical protein NDU88_000932 [Pleurodeles waltl]
MVLLRLTLVSLLGHPNSSFEKNSAPSGHSTEAYPDSSSNENNAPSGHSTEGHPNSSFEKNSAPSGHSTEGEVYIELHFLIIGAVGISLVSAVIAFLVSCCFMRGCKGKKKKDEQEEDEVSMQYASLQNLPIKEGDASREPEQDAEKKTCYATIADIMNEPHPVEEKVTDGVSLKENP